jgi:hypothetical protein
VDPALVAARDALARRLCVAADDPALVPGAARGGPTHEVLLLERTAELALAAEPWTQETPPPPPPSLPY